MRVYVFFGDFITIPGKPATLDVSFNNSRRAHVLEGSSTELTVRVYDAYGNLVGDDTSVNIRVLGDALIRNADDESQQSYQAGTRSGVVRAAITGGMRAGDFSAIVSAGDVGTTVDFTVHPYTITAVEVPDRLQPGSSVPLTFKVTDTEGNDAPEGLPVSAFAEGLIVDQSSAQTGANGELVIQVAASTAPQTASLKLSVGRSAGLNHEFLIQGAHAHEDVNARILVGDQVGTAPIPYQRFDGQQLDLPVPADAPVHLRGESGDTRRLSLGTPSMPNVQPVVAYHLGGGTSIGEDALGLHHAQLKTLNSDPDTPQPQVRSFYQGRPGKSVQFKGENYLESRLSSQLIDPTALGFRLDVFLDTAEAGTGTQTLLNLANGVLQLTRSGESSVALNVAGDGQSHSILTGNVVTGWHSLAGVLQNGELDLYLDDGLIDSVAVTSLDLPAPTTDADTGELIYPLLDVQLAKGLHATLDNVELYNPQSEPLLAFADGSTDKTLDLGNGDFDGATGQYTTQLSIRSTGKLNTAQSGARLYSRAVMLHSDSGGAYPISLLSRDAYRDIAGTYAVTAYAYDHPGELPPIDDAGVDAIIAGTHNTFNGLAQAGNFLIKPAHAGWFGWSADDFFDGIKSVASLLLPINEIEAIWVQLGYLATDPDKFDGMDLVINIVSLATYFPVLKPLTPVVRPVKALFSKVKGIGNPKFASALGGVLGTAFEKLYKTGSTAKLQALLPFILIAYEMRGSWEAVEVMVKGIESDDDLWGWIEYFNLPEGGWEGEGEPPPLDLALAPTANQATQYAGLGLLDLVVPRVEAAKTSFVRKSGDVLGTMIKRIKAKFGADFDPAQFTVGITSLTRGLQHSASQSLRQASGSKTVAAAAYIMARYAKARMKIFLQGKSSARVQAPIFMSIMTYLESQLQEGGYLDTLDKNKNISAKIRTLYSKAMADILLPGALAEEKPNFGENNDAVNPPLSTGSISSTLNGSAHGAMYHLAMIAYYTATRELDNIERSVWARFCDEDEFSEDKGTNQPMEECRGFIRHVDIVLKSDGSGERWVELKSLKRADLAKPFIPSSDGFKTWASSRDKSFKSTKYGQARFGKITYHKQFALDRAAMMIGAKRTKGEVEASIGGLSYDLEVKDIEWKFHQFHVKPKGARKEEKSVQVGKVSIVGNIRERLSDLPNARAKRLGKARKEFTYKIDSAGQSSVDRASFATKVNNFNVLNVLKDRLEVSGDLTDELLEILEEEAL